MGKVKQDLTGLQFFDWTVLFRNGTSPNKKMPLWRCRCKCGTERDVRACNLRYGHTKSCGCRPHKTQSAPNPVAIGERFERLVVLERLENSHVLCRCDCGSERIYQAGNLRSGGTRSCGCLRRDKAAERSFRHGMMEHPAYNSWSGAKSRCFNPDDHGFNRYGGRGITMCERWIDSFENFWADMGPTWFVGATIERIRGDGDYEPSNCE